MTSIMLGSLSVGCWTARKKDRKSAEKIETEAKAKHGTSSASKHLMAGVESFERTSKFATAFRVWWSTRTLPWYDGKGGPRAVHPDAVMDLQVEVGDRERNYLELASEFVREYTAIWPQRVYDMGDLFDPREFPDPRDMMRRFYVRTSWSALPRVADIRVNASGMSKTDIDAMVEQAKLAEQQRIQTAMNTAAQRLFKVVKSMHDTMSVPIGEKGGGFHNSKLENIAQMAELIPMFNITNDPKLAELALKAKKLSIKSPDELKKDVDKRSRAASEAKVLADAIASAFDVEGDEDADD
jgi:hypothetical protein